MAMAPVDNSPQTFSDLPDSSNRLSRPIPGAYMALGLLLAINVFNYIDRQVLAGVEPEIRRAFFPLDPDGLAARTQSGSLASVFMITYMLIAPLFGALASRWPRLKWKLIAAGVLIWSLATGAGGLAASFMIMLMTALFRGRGRRGLRAVGADDSLGLLPGRQAGKYPLAVLCGDPRGRRLGLCPGRLYRETRSGPRELAVGVFRRRYPGIDPGNPLALNAGIAHRRGRRGLRRKRMTWRDYRILLRTPSYVFDTLGMTAMTFGMGALAWWIPDYLESHHVDYLFGIEPRTVFGIILALAGLGGTISGGLLGDWLRVRLPGSYFLVSGVGLLLSALCVLLFLVMPFPWAWFMIFAAVFFMFLNTGPTNAILANVVHPAMRPAGFAVNILVIHVLGDVISPPIIGAVAGHWKSMSIGFVVVSAFLAIGGLLWLWGGRYLDRDTEIAPQRLA